MAETTIEWTRGPNGEPGFTFNPWTGCMQVGPGCDRCYAEIWSRRAGDKVGQWGPGAPRVRTTPANWKKPLKWNAQAQAEGKRYRVFCASLADVFDNEVPTEWRRDLFKLIADTPHLDWLLLTKRIGNATRMMDEIAWNPVGPVGNWQPMPNVWIGATITSQEEADRDIPKLLAVPASVRFLSMEPLLGPVDLGRWIGDEDCHVCGARFYGDALNRLDGAVVAVDFETEPEDENDVKRMCPKCGARDLCGEVGPVDGAMPHHGLHWVIVGGESGPGARPMHPAWARSLRDQCAAAGVPFFFKQWGEWAPATTLDDLRSLGDAMRAGKAIHVYGNGREPDGHFRRGDDHLLHVGKKAAGRLLDGKLHDDQPELRHAA